MNMGKEMSKLIERKLELTSKLENQLNKIPVGKFGVIKRDEFPSFTPWEILFRHGSNHTVILKVRDKRLANKIVKELNQTLNRWEDK